MSGGTYAKLFDQPIGWNMPDDHVRCHVFAEMVKLANPLRMSANVSDLFHDAMFVEENVHGHVTKFVFWYACRETGTDCTKVMQHVSALKEHNRDVYKFTIERVNKANRGVADYEHRLAIWRWEPE